PSFGNLHEQWSPIGPVATLDGTVVQAHVASDDNFLNHASTDYNWFVYPDQDFRGLLANCGNFCIGADVEHGRIECEWEIENLYLGDKHPAYGLPQWAWPTQGDRVHVVGNFVADCAHVDASTNSSRTEMHPPRLVVTYRNAAGWT